MKHLDTLLWGMLVIVVICCLIVFFESDEEQEPPALTEVNEELTVNPWDAS